MSKKNLLSLFFILVCSFSKGQTFLHSVISNDTTITLSSSPVYFKDTVTVLSGATVYVEPGVTFIGEKDALILLYGKFVSEASASDSIFFTVAHSDPDINNFRGFLVKSGGQGIFRYTSVSFAKKFAEIESGGSLTVANSLFRNSKQVFFFKDPVLYVGSSIRTSRFFKNLYGIDQSRGILIEQNVFHKNIYGIRNDGFSDIRFNKFIENTDVGLSGEGGKVTNNYFYLNEMGMVYSQTLDLQIYLPGEVKGNEFRKNTIGLKITGQEATIPFKENIFCGNTMYHVQHATSYTGSVAYNCWCEPDLSSIEQKVFDKPEDITIGSLVKEPVSSGCPLFPLEYFIEGDLHGNSASYTLLLLDEGFEYYSHAPLIQSSFRIDSVLRGSYHLLALPSDREAEIPTWYTNKSNQANSVPIHVAGPTGELDMYLQQKATPDGALSLDADPSFSVYRDNFIFIKDAGNNFIWWGTGAEIIDDLPQIRLSYGEHEVLVLGDNGFSTLLAFKSDTLMNDLLTLRGAGSVVPDMEQLEAVVFPNPASDKVTIVSSYMLTHASLVSMHGEKWDLILSGDSLDLSGFSEGLYVLEIVHTGGILRKKLIVQ